MTLFVFGAQRVVLSMGLDFAHILQQGKLKLIDCCSFKLSST
jgi:hypothetical protein